MKLTRGDIILVVILIIFSIFLAIFMSRVDAEVDKKYVSIQVNGEEIKAIKFSKDIIGKTYEVDTKYGRNVIQFEDGAVKIIEASCKDLLCIKQGTISKVGQLLVCLPNRLVVEIRDGNPNSEIIDNFAF